MPKGASTAIVIARELPYITAMSASFHVSPAAISRIAHLLASEPAGTRLRVAVDGGGCSGFQYRYEFVSEPPAADDQIFGSEAAPVMVDSTSLTFLSGSELDYIERMDSAAFEIKNPNAKSGCGCGNSFSVAL